eukprot:TRINITY_DN23430_c0_g1_i1.p1 TRINITY_DN23430_c0_g1~~TRINITY_DN23430_c0_g1_i1.p1  ORF type:complete len:143 (+),score=16.08 TRINITY_DN23430_c0_g1_i1:268-696(+)
MARNGVSHLAVLLTCLLAGSAVHALTPRHLNDSNYFLQKGRHWQGQIDCRPRGGQFTVEDIQANFPGKATYDVEALKQRCNGDRFRGPIVNCWSATNTTTTQVHPQSQLYKAFRWMSSIGWYIFTAQGYRERYQIVCRDDLK